MKESKIYNLTMMGVMVAVLCILAPMSITIPVSAVPISFTNLAIYLMVYILGWKKATISYLVYFLLGIIGLPVFSNHEGGLQKLFGGTGGYLIGFIFMTIICGIIVEKYYKNAIICFLGMAAGTIVAYAMGTVWLAHIYELSFMKALTLGVIPFVIGDIVKMIIAIIAGSGVRKGLIHAGVIK